MKEAGPSRVLQAYFRNPLGVRAPHDLAPVGRPAGRTVQRGSDRASGDPVRVFRAPAGFLGPGAHRAGQRLPDPLLRKMEKLFDADLSAVRVHVGKEAARIGALAFTTGEEIHVAPGLYHPHTRSGQQLLGHELTHVLQQRAGLVTNPLGAGLAVVQDDALEAEADRFGRLAAGQPPGGVADLPSWRGSRPRADEARARSIGPAAAAQRLVRTGPQALTRSHGRNLTGAAPLVVQPWGAAARNLATDTALTVRGTAQHVRSAIGSVADYAMSTVTGPLGYAYEGVSGAVNYLGGALLGIGQHALRGTSGLAAFGRDALTGVLGYLYDTLAGPARFLWRLPGAYAGARAHVIPLPGGGVLPVPARGGGLTPLLTYILRNLGNAIAHVFEAGAGPLRYVDRGVRGVGGYLGDAGARTIGYLGQGGAGAAAYAGRGRARLVGHVTRGLTGARDEVGYFRAAAIAFGLLGAAAAPWIGIPALYGLAAGAIPYLHDLFRFLALQGYERRHPGYHSVARHSAFHLSGNLRNRRLPAAPPRSHMRSFSLQRVNQAPVSSQFRTANWHWFSNDQAWQRLLAIDPAAVLLSSQPNPQFPGYRFTIQYPGWDTGITHNAATGPGGVRTEYVFSNYIRDAAGGHNYFLVQHFPQTGPLMNGGVAGAHNTVVNTWRPV